MKKLSFPAPNLLRRQALKKLVAAPTWIVAKQPATKLLLFIGTVLPATPARADPVQIGLAVGSAVVGMIAAHNRGDGGIASLLQANLEYQRSMTQQLLSLQSSMVEVLTRLASLPAATKSMLRAERIESLQGELRVHVINYHQEATLRSSTMGSYQEWITNEQTRQTLYAIQNGLAISAGRVAAEHWYDPLTTLNVTVAAFTALSVRTALGEPLHSLKAEAQRYLDLLKSASDPNEKSSTARELISREKNLIDLKKDLGEKGVQLPKEGEPAIKIRLGRISIQDYSPKKIISEDIICEDPVPVNKEIKDELFFQESKTNKTVTGCEIIRKYSNERLGEKETFSLEAEIKIIFISEKGPNGKEVSILQYAISPDLLITTVEPLTEPDRSQPLPGSTTPQFKSKEPDTIRAEALTHDEKVFAAKASENYSSAKILLSQIKDLVDNTNLNIAHISLCSSALTAANLTRDEILSFFSKGV